MAGSTRGRPEIRINKQLQAPTTQIADELLEYLLWHELCHHVLPGRGHDAEFRRLESLWPDFARLDHELDTLHERFNLGWED
jgi:predicted metal-dependent hydrolase